ncbi:hypothetical protein QQF64_017925 [Cirrhinus molitorella]|uniref:Uncharacterized protein n=1 Tax=Cirrhinus molitorella TaxID=172907 RepID=A0ABR3LK14_9TELE
MPLQRDKVALSPISQHSQALPVRTAGELQPALRRRKQRRSADTLPLIISCCPREQRRELDLSSHGDSQQDGGLKAGAQEEEV